MPSTIVNVDDSEFDARDQVSLSEQVISAGATLISGEVTSSEINAALPLVNRHWLHSYIRSGFDIRELNKLYSQKFGERDLKFFHLISQCDFSVSEPLWLLWKVKIRNFSGTLNENDDLTNLLKVVNSERVLKGGGLNELVTGLMLLENWETFIEVIDKEIKHFEVVNTNFAVTLIKCLTRLKRQDLIKKISGDGARLREIQLKLLDFVPAKFERTHLSVAKAISSQLIGTPSHDVLLNYTDNLMDLSFGRRSQFDIRHDRKKLSKFQHEIVSAARKGNSFSLIRLGDGEAYATHLHSAKVEFSIKEIHWWGKNLNYVERSKIIGAVRTAVRKANALGIPSYYRVARDIRSTDTLAELRRPIQDLRSVMEWAASESDRLRCETLLEDRCHQWIFTRKFIDELNAVAKRTFVISCWNEDQLLAKLPTGCLLRQVPGQQKVAKLEDGTLADSYGEHVNWVRENVQVGDVVLVAAGLLGKILIAEAAETGAVALDIGSALDYLVGRRTRNPAD
ncbi:MAG: hypothetical protein ABJK39_14460 [Hyphomicrobiales bacterium]